MGMEGSHRTWIPSNEDFERAKRLDRERSRNLDLVCENVKSSFMKKCALHNVYILSQQDVDFRAYVFFKKDKDVEECEANGTLQAIEDFIYAELDRVGRGKQGEITVAFEIDSDENVAANYGGHYYLRLR
jgi:hypothetical protein